MVYVDSRNLGYKPFVWKWLNARKVRVRGCAWECVLVCEALYARVRAVESVGVSLGEREQLRLSRCVCVCVCARVWVRMSMRALSMLCASSGLRLPGLPCGQASC